jgi:transposase
MCVSGIAERSRSTGHTRGCTMRELTNEQWEWVEPYLPMCYSSSGPPLVDDRAVLEAVIWVLRTGAAWHDLPGRFPPYATCHRRFLCWQRCMAIHAVLQALAEDLRLRADIDVRSFQLVLDHIRQTDASHDWRTKTVRVFLHTLAQEALRHDCSPRSCPKDRRSATRLAVQRVE